MIFKINHKKYCFIIVLLLLVSCHSKVKTNEKVNLHRKWMLVKLDTIPKDTLIKYEAYIDLSSKDKTGGAYMGCNQMGFDYKISKSNSILFTNVIGNQMYCNKTMHIETIFSEQIKEITDFSLHEAHQLILTGRNGKQMKFVAQDWD